MERHPFLILGVLAAALLLAALFHHRTRPTTPRIDGAKIVATIAAYRGQLASAGEAVPRTVPLREFVAQGLLDARDLEAFAGLEVTVSPAADESRPNEVLLSARFPDGDQLVVLADGSVQSSRP